LIDELQATKREGRQIKDLIMNGVAADQVGPIMKLMEGGHFNSIAAAKLAYKGQLAEQAEQNGHDDEEEGDADREARPRKKGPVRDQEDNQDQDEQPPARKRAAGSIGSRAGEGGPGVTPQRGGTVTAKQWAKLMERDDANDYIRAQRLNKIRVIRG